MWRHRSSERARNFQLANSLNAHRRGGVSLEGRERFLYAPATLPSCRAAQTSAASRPAPNTDMTALTQITASMDFPYPLAGAAKSALKPGALHGAVPLDLHSFRVQSLRHSRANVGLHAGVTERQRELHERLQMPRGAPFADGRRGARVAAPGSGQRLPASRHFRGVYGSGGLDGLFERFERATLELLLLTDQCAGNLGVGVGFEALAEVFARRVFLVEVFDLLDSTVRPR